MKPYLISVYSYTEGKKFYDQTLQNLKDSVEQVDIRMDKYPGHLHRWDYIPSDLDRRRVFIFTDTGDVLFQKPIPELSPDFVYVANEHILIGESSIWRMWIRRYPEFHVLDKEIDYNVGCWACGGYLMDEWVNFLKKTRTDKTRNVCEQLIYNLWLHTPRIEPLIRDLPSFAVPIADSLRKGYVRLKEGLYVNNKSKPYSICHFNGNTKETM